MRSGFIIFLVAISIVNACHKSVEADNLYIHGRLFLYDPITRNTNNSIPIAGKTVLLSTNSADSLNFLYSDTTDAAGYFNFTLLATDDKDFIVRFEDTINGYYYFAKDTVTRGEENGLLVAGLNQRKQNGVYVTTTANQGALPNTTLRMFGSASLAVTNDTLTAVATLRTDEYGHAFKFNLPAGTYYINAEKKINNETFHALAQSVEIESSGIIPKQIDLSKKDLALDHGFIITIKDIDDRNSAGATVYLYNNEVLAASNDPLRAIASFTSDNLGIVSKFNLPASVYYLNAMKKTDNDLRYRMQKLVDLTTSPLIVDSMLIKNSQ